MLQNRFQFSKLVASLESLPTPELRSQLQKAIELTAEHLLRVAAIVSALEKRGEDLGEIRIGMLGILRRIACGQLLPEVVVKFQGSAALNKISSLPLPDQQKLLSGDVVKLVCRVEGKTTHRMVDPTKITAAEASQLFGRDHIRDEGEQARYLDRRLVEPIADGVLVGVRIDRKRRRVLVSGTDIPISRADLLRLAAELVK